MNARGKAGKAARSKAADPATKAAKERLRPAHDALTRSLDPVRVRLDVARLRCHTEGATRSEAHLEDMAELYDDVRVKLDEVTQTLDGAYPDRKRGDDSRR